MIRPMTGWIRSGVSREVVAEFVGTAFLVAAVVGSAIAVARLTPDGGLRLLVSSLVTGSVLLALILALHPVSAAFNPLVTAVDAALGRRSWHMAGLLTVAQIAGGVSGAVIANLMFELDAVSLSEQHRSGLGIWTGEVVATIGLVLVAFCAIQSGRAEVVAPAVAGYVSAASWFTSSTSFANPAVTISRMLSGSSAGISPSSALMFVLFQLVGAALAALLVRFLVSAGERDPESDRLLQ